MEKLKFMPLLSMLVNMVGVLGAANLKVEQKSYSIKRKVAL
jgi:hypothetical protein